jgi:hypothetical protein
MSEWQKVRVQFTDADGNKVSAALWAREGHSGVAYVTAGSNDDLLFSWYPDKGQPVIVTPMRELPTGVGAVIRVTASNDSFNLYGDTRDIFVSDVSGEWWGNSDGDVCANTAMQDWQYEVLSEGIKL